MIPVIVHAFPVGGHASLERLAEYRAALMERMRQARLAGARCVAHAAERPTFKDAFSLATAWPGSNVHVFMNEDCYMPASTLTALSRMLHGRVDVLCGLTRWDVTRIDSSAEAEATFFNVDGSQDAWAFFASGDYVPRARASDPLTFPFGAAGCDHRIAAEFARQGFTLINPAKRLRVYHYHPSGVRSWLPPVGGPYIAIPFTE